IRFSRRTPVWTRSTVMSVIWYDGTKLLRLQQAVQQGVLLRPDPSHPVLETLPHLARLGHRVGDELGRDVDPPRPDADPRHLIGDEVPDADVVAGIGQGHVEEGIELIAERGQGEADPADAGAEQVRVR